MKDFLLSLVASREIFYRGLYLWILPIVKSIDSLDSMDSMG
jgi:hypothetical protein